MLQDLAKQENGLFCIKTVNFPLLLLPVLVGTAPSTPSSHRVPGRAPTPWAKKKDDEKDILPPVPRDLLDRARRRATGTPARRRLEDDFAEDEEKENQPPNDENYEGPRPDHLSRLLEQWGHDIDWLKTKVSQDLDDYKRRLGIPTSSY
uniref:E4 protein n=1 Tax=Human papillomavirus TaxID=10566 RepID=A0A3R5T6X6_9PAPI|nr:MAG: E4 protein [Human papillomavirus]